ncbi:transporter associated domain-containing protein [uncultured Thiothrix sp.]|jgi:magnesium and cobalt transporter|uniref:HlyC/CorC family transporter n=1 Tax=uncultured Thiothrix sp. TaxID=223185 RepID=UPI00260A8C18|nr:transporter associated domain-containing protein [uncultured Thiothrix sp.]HMT92928.1 transporter associated domain-containing protein [Thiolinea sp.]
MKNNELASSQPRPRWKQWLIDHLDLASQTPSQLMDDLQRANDKNILHTDEVKMIQGVLEFGSRQVREIMIPRSQISFIEHDANFPEILTAIAETEHSRYPVMNKSKDELVGILIAKDLLQYIGRADSFAMNDIVRPALLVPESQRLNRLLAEFRNSRSHMAVVLDEYAGVTGLVTFEDVLEQIVGEIDDEHDDEGDLNIRQQAPNVYLVNATTTVNELNEVLGTNFVLDDYETVAGLVMQAMGKIPNIGEEVLLEDVLFRILESDSRRILLLEVQTESNPIINE